MTDTEIDIDSFSNKHLRRKPEHKIKELEQSGLAYAESLTRLQIRPAVQQKFWEDNRVRSWRDKHALELLKNGNDGSLRTLSETFLRAFGQLTWHNNRGWLFEKEQLDGEQELRYKQPKERQEGDHDRFFAILEPMWKSMRKNLFEPKKGALTDLTTDTESVSSSSSGTRTRTSRARVVNRHERLVQRTMTPANEFAPPSPSPIDRRRDQTALIEPSMDQITKPRPIKQQQQARLPQERGSSDPARDEFHYPGKWTAAQTEEALLQLIVELHEIRINSHEGTFRRLFERHLARLEEIEYVDELQQHSPRKPDDHKKRSSEAGAVTEEQDVMAHNAYATGRTATEGAKVASTDTGEKRSLVLKLKIPQVVQEVLKQDENISTGSFANNSSRSSGPTTDASLETARAVLHQLSESNTAQVQAAQRLLLPRLRPLTLSADSPTQPSIFENLLLPATIPETLTACITPYSNTSASAQPYIWLDAPITPSSFERFKDGACLRAEVPRGVRVENIILVLAYGWSDACRVVRGQQDWSWVNTDIREAASRGVDRWRLRVCVVR